MGWVDPADQPILKPPWSPLCWLVQRAATTGGKAGFGQEQGWFLRAQIPTVPGHLGHIPFGKRNILYFPLLVSKGIDFTTVFFLGKWRVFGCH